MNKLLAATIGAILLATPVNAWESVKEMNDQIDQTNFIVGGGCSGTLISIEQRLIVTAYHCVSSYIKIRNKDVVGDDGKLEKERFEERRKMTVFQKDYEDFDQVGSLSYQTEIVAYYKERDLALLQLVGKKLRSTTAAPLLSIGEIIHRGEKVFAVGDFFGQA